MILCDSLQYRRVVYSTLGVSIDDCYGVLQKALQCPRTRLNTGVSGFLNVIRCYALLRDFGLYFEVLLAGY